MTQPTPAVPVDEPETNDTADAQRPTHEHGRPTSDGPGQHHPNADTSHSAAPQARTTHQF